MASGPIDPGPFGRMRPCAYCGFLFPEIVMDAAGVCPECERDDDTKDEW